jgi:hypothetical protein
MTPILRKTGVSPVSSKIGPIRRKASIDPSMNTSPWAKLMSSMMP